MTDIHPWWRLLHRATKADVQGTEPVVNAFGDTVFDFNGSYYGMVPLNDYQVGNLLAFFDGVQRRGWKDDSQSINQNSGDWWLEIPWVLCAYVQKFTKPGPSIHDNLRSNNGWYFYWNEEKKCVMAYKMSDDYKNRIEEHVVMM